MKGVSNGDMFSPSALVDGHRVSCIKSEKLSVLHESDMLNIFA